MTDVRAFPKHARKLNFCMKQCRAFYTEKGLDWTEFVERGTPVQVLRATGDARAIHVASVAEEEAEHG